MVGIQLEVAGQSIEVKAAVLDTLPVSVLLGTDVVQLSKILSSKMARQDNGEYEVMVVTTRVEAAWKQEETLREVEREAQVMVTPNPLCDEEEIQPVRITQTQQRQIWQTMANQSTVNHTNNPLLFLDISSEEMAQYQEDDPTLAKIRDLVNTRVNDKSVQFFKCNGLYFRKWVPPGQGEEMEIEQLLIVLKMQERLETMKDIVQDNLTKKQRDGMTETHDFTSLHQVIKCWCYYQHVQISYLPNGRVLIELYIEMGKSHI